VKCLLDSGFLYALADADDDWHAEVLLTVQEHPHVTFVLPISVLPEVLYLIGSRLGYTEMRHFLEKLLAWNVQLESLDKADLRRVTKILNHYADAHLDFVDATIIAIAERLNITCVLTVDRRDFSIVQPEHCQFFELLP
jgi:hypothetical protein